MQWIGGTVTIDEVSSSVTHSTPLIGVTPTCFELQISYPLNIVDGDGEYCKLGANVSSWQSESEKRLEVIYVIRSWLLVRESYQCSCSFFQGYSCLLGQWQTFANWLVCWSKWTMSCRWLCGVRGSWKFCRQIRIWWGDFSVQYFRCCFLWGGLFFNFGGTQCGALFVLSSFIVWNRLRCVKAVLYRMMRLWLFNSMKLWGFSFHNNIRQSFHTSAREVQVLRPTSWQVFKIHCHLMWSRCSW